MSAIGTLRAPADRNKQIAYLLFGAVDLHCHSGPSVMPRILDLHPAQKAVQAA